MTRKVLKIIDGKKEWVFDGYGKGGSSEQRKMPACGEDLTLDGYIRKHGGIESQIDGKAYTTKSGYLDHLKRNNCHIKDY
jgi:hypothetical protein